MRDVLVHIAGVLMFTGLGSILYNMMEQRMTKVRKPLYWLALPMAVIMCGLYVNFFVDSFFHFRLFPSTASQTGMIAMFFLLGILLTLVPYADRKEYEQITRQLAEAEDLKKRGAKEFHDAVKDIEGRSDGA